MTPQSARPHADRSQQPDDQAELDPVADRHANVICAHCITENDPFTHFCRSCGLPLTAYATIAPLEQIYTLGHGYREATERPTRPVIFFGLWLLLGPQVLVCIGSLLAALSDRLRHPPDPVGGATATGAFTAGTVGLFMVTAMMAIYMTILYKATRNYLRHRRTGAAVA